MSAHAEVLSRGVHVEPTRLDDRSWNDVSRFHGGTPSGAEGVGGRAIGCRHERGPTASSEPPSESAARVTARALWPWQNLESARPSGLARGSLAADERVNCAG